MMAARVWLIGGTSESAALASALSSADVPYIVTVTTAAARRLYPQTAEVWVGQLSAQSVDAFIRRWQVRCILDASHPFASEISRLAIAIAERSFVDQRVDQRVDGREAIAYLRYERHEIHPPSRLNRAATDKTITSVKSIKTLLESDILQRQRVLFTLGYRQLSQFAPSLACLRQESQLFARVLPSVEAIAAVLAAGFAAQEIVAIRPPVSTALERALWQQWEISTVVAKASGVAGGEAVKRAIAAELGVRLILIERPLLIYPKQTNLISKATEFCSEMLRL